MTNSIQYNLENEVKYPHLTDEDIKIKIGNRIKNQSKKHNIKVQELADVLYLSERTIKAYRKGEKMPSLSTLLSMCNIFHCDIEYLLGFQECETKETTDIQKATGLSEKAIQEICNRPEYYNYSLNAGNDFDLPLDYDSLNWCITHGLLDIVDALHNVRNYGCVIRRMNISKELQNIINDSFSDASKSNIYFQMDDIRYFVNSLIQSLSKYDIEKLSKFKDELSSLPHQGLIHDIDESDKKTVIDEIEYINANFNKSLNKELQKMIYYISLYVLQFCYRALYFKYTLETSKFTISKKFDALVDDYMNQFVNQEGDEK